jgi:hypothetical protein
MAYKHHITSPRDGDTDVAVVQHGTRYYIDATGVPDDDSDGFVIVEVYGRVFASQNQIPTAQQDIRDMIAHDGDCIAGTPGSSSDLYYKFRDSANNSIPVQALDVDNFLQVWARFKGDTSMNYIAADRVIKFTPKLPP